MANKAHTQPSQQASSHAPRSPSQDVSPILPRPLSASAIREKFEGLEQCLKSRLVRNDETQEEFDRLFDHLLEATNPRNAIEFIYIRKAADITAQINRYERDRDGLLVAEQMRILEPYLKDWKFEPDIETALLQWARGAESAVTGIGKILKGQGVELHHIHAKALENKLGAIQKIEIIINSLEHRRFSLFREIDRHREALGKQLQEAIRLQDGSYSIVFAQGEEPLTKGASGTSHGSK